MRLATIDIDGTTTAIVADDGGFVRIDKFADLGALLAAGDDGRSAAEAALLDTGRTPIDGVRFRQPVLAPGAVVCVGLNYRTHILEMGREIPTNPTLFAKLPRAMTDPQGDVELPSHSGQVDYEGELAVVIGRAGRDIPESEAWDHVGGLTVLNDVTARDYQRRTVQWFAGKTWEGSTPFGPWVVTPDELGDISSLQLRLRVNGEERQRAALGDLVFGVDALVADVSRIVKLHPGDVIATGTPGGVGEATGRFLTDGDVVEVEIDRIGTLRSTFRKRAS